MLPGSLVICDDATNKIYECPLIGWLFLGNQHMPAKGWKALPQEVSLKGRDDLESMSYNFYSVPGPRDSLPASEIRHF
jgi:hypothetical protein